MLDIFDPARRRVLFLKYKTNFRHFFRVGALLRTIVFWPSVWLMYLRIGKIQERNVDYGALTGHLDDATQDEIALDLLRRSSSIFWESVIYALILLGINFALVEYFGLDSVPPDVAIWV